MTGGLHERERELGAIAVALDAGAAGEGCVVLVEGPAGIGKTRLVASAREDALARGYATATARASELERAYGWGLVRQLLEPRLRGMSRDARAQLLSGAAALAGPVVLPDERAFAGDADASFGVLHGLYWLVAGLAEQRPLLLVVDDLHWADVTSMRFLEFLAVRLDALSVVLLVTQRRGAASASLRAQATALELAALSPDGTAALLADRTGAPVSTAFAAACHDATGGNPLLISRLALGLHEHGAADAEAVTRRGPFVLAGAVTTSLARLGAGPVALARAVAVLGTPPLMTAARLARVGHAESMEFSEQLVRAGILRNARPLEFEHALVRDAVLEGLTAGERAQLHAEAARTLADAGGAPEDVALHLLHTEPSGDDAVAATLAATGRRALAAGAPAEAEVMLTRALAEPAPPAERSALLLDLARSEYGLGRPGVLDHVREAHRVALDDEGLARAALALQWASGPGQQDPDEALAMIEAAIPGVAGRDRELELELDATRYAVALMSPARTIEILGEAEQFADVEGRTAGECQVLPFVGFHRFLLGRSAADSAAPVERAVSNADIVAAIGPDSAWLPFVNSVLFKTDRLAAARRTADIALGEAQRRGSAPGFVAVLVWRAWIALREGRAADAESDVRAACDIEIDPGTWQIEYRTACLIEVLVERGALDEARVILDAFDPNPGPRVFFLYVHSIVREAEGNARGALEVQLASRGGDALPGPDPDFDGWLRIARLRHATGDEDGAAREAAAALRWAREWGTPAYIGQALTVAGTIAGDLAKLREAVAQLERSPAGRELARSLVELGAALRRAGERRAAREPLRRALDLATAGGLVAIAERASEELRVTGAKLRRPEASGLDALTPSERRIVDLAAAGASNPEIAQALFVTVKTVEMHLGNAYRKLGINSRRQLAPLLPG